MADPTPTKSRIDISLCIEIRAVISSTNCDHIWGFYISSVDDLRDYAILRPLLSHTPLRFTVIHIKDGELELSVFERAFALDSRDSVWSALA